MTASSWLGNMPMLISDPVRGRAIAAQVDASAPGWYVYHSLRGRDLVAMPLWPFPRPVVLSGADPADLLQRMRAAEEEYLPQRQGGFGGVQELQQGAPWQEPVPASPPLVLPAPQWAT